MKYIGTKPWGQDKDIQVPIFAINPHEVRLLRAILIKTKQYMPRTLETIKPLGQVRNMLREIDLYLDSTPTPARLDARLAKGEQEEGGKE
jgi:hypothetical protein